MIFHDDELDDQLKDKLALLVSTQPRDSEKATRGRNVFMRKVREFRSRNAPYVVAPRSDKGLFQALFGRRLSVAPLAIALMIALGLIFGGGWGTVYAAQDSLPNDFLYPVKLAAENVHLTFTANPEAKIALLTTYTERRIEEATSLVSQGEPIPEELPDLVDEQLDEIFALAATMDDESMQVALTGVQRHLRPRDQEQDMTNEMGGTPEGVDPQLSRLLAMLKERQQLAQAGLETPNTFQQQFKNHGPTQPITPTLTTTVTSTITSTITVTPDITVTLTITPGHHGPGPCDVPGACTPPAEEHGPNQYKGTPPGPDDHEGYGPGSEQGSGPQEPTATPVPEDIEEPNETPDPGDSNNTKSKKKDGSSNKGSKP